MELNTVDEFIIITTGGPKKVYRHKKVRNPHYIKPKPEPMAVPEKRQLVIGGFRNARLQKRMTQKQLADKLKTYQSVVSKFEAGKFNPSLDFLERYADILDRKLNITLK